MSRLGVFLRAPLLLGGLGFFLHCGTAAPVLLLTLDGVPPETARFRATVSKDGKSNVAAFERNDKNTYVVAPSPTMPAMMMGSPTLVRVALDLPAAAVGELLVKITVEKPDMMSMTMPPMLKSVDMACAKISIEAGQVNSRVLTLKEGAVCP